MLHTITTDDFLSKTVTIESFICVQCHLKYSVYLGLQVFIKGICDIETLH